MNRAQRRALGISGEIAEHVEDAIDTTKQTMRNARGVQPATVLNVEHHNTVEHGHVVLLTLDTPHGPQAFALQPDDAAAAARRMHDLAGDAATGLFVAR